MAGNQTNGIHFPNAEHGTVVIRPAITSANTGSASPNQVYPNGLVNVCRPGFQLHPVVPEDLLIGPAVSGKSFLDFPGIPSADTNLRYYNAVFKSGLPERGTAMVRTLDRCDVLCSTRDCPGLSRLRVWELLQICHHVGDELDGQTFVVHVATEGTPEVSRVASRVGSRAPTRPSAPVESGDLDTGQA